VEVELTQGCRKLQHWAEISERLRRIGFSKAHAISVMAQKAHSNGVAVQKRTPSAC